MTKEQIQERAKNLTAEAEHLRHSAQRLQEQLAAVSNAQIRLQGRLAELKEIEALLYPTPLEEQKEHLPDTQ